MTTQMELGQGTMVGGTLQGRRSRCFNSMLTSLKPFLPDQPKIASYGPALVSSFGRTTGIWCISLPG